MQFAAELLPDEPVPSDPALLAFLAALEGSIHPDGTSAAARRELEAAEGELSAHRQRAISAGLLLDEVKLLLAEQHGVEEGAVGGTLESVHLLERSLSIAEATHGRVSDGGDVAAPRDRLAEGMHLSSMESALGLRDRDTPEQLQQMRGELLPLLEQRLRAR